MDTKNKMKGILIKVFLLKEILSLRSSIDLRHENEGQNVYLDYSNNDTIGSLVSLINNLNISVNNNTFESIKTTGTGGSLRYVAPFTSYHLKDNSFINSSSTSHGGSVYLTGIHDLNINNCSFIDSQCSNYGGAAYISSTNALIENVYCENILASSHAGTLYLTGTTHFLTNVSIINSRSGQNGGAIFCSVNTFKFYNSRIQLSQITVASKIGGAIYSSSGTLFDVNGCLFIHIYCSGHGGAIHLNAGGTMPIYIKETTFYNCSSFNGNGGAVYVVSSSSSYHLSIEIDKICATQCSITSSTSSFGHVLFIDSSAAANSISTLSYISMHSCGEITQGISNLYVYESQPKLLNTNGSYCQAFRSSIFYFLPTFTVSCHYNTYFNNSSPNFDCIFIQGPATVYSASIQNSNFIRNYCPASIINVTAYGSRLTIQECIFINNTGFVLMKSNIANILVKNCYIYHLTTVGVNATFESTKTTKVNTQTYQLSHYSTVFCSTPDDMGQLELPCQTIPIPPTAIPNCQDCITLPPTQTECFIESAGNISLLSQIIGIIRSSLLLFNFIE